MNRIIGHFIFCIVLCLYSCRDYDVDFYEKNKIPETSGKEVVDGDPEPLRPNLELGMQGLYGIDSDGDGVRDDIEIWINHNIPEKPQRLYFKGLAKIKSKELEMAESGIYISKEYYLESLNFYICGSIAFNGSENDHIFHKKFFPIFLNNNIRKSTNTDFQTKGPPAIIASNPPFEHYRYISKKYCPWDHETNSKLLDKFLAPMRHNLHF